MVTWRLLDGRRGHFTQIEGLTQALAEHTSLDVHDITIRSKSRHLWEWILGRFSSGRGLPAPDLILAAGHKTHLAGLAARRVCGGRIVVLMKPSLPLSWFDLCLIPAHDRPPRRENVVETQGAITTVRPSGDHATDTGLILLGGPSRHHDWDTAAMLTQIRAILEAQPQAQFALSDSPRTPGSMREALARLGGIESIHWETCQPGYIQERMRHTGQIWVSEDSVSMLFEAISSSAPTGLLAVPRRRRTRISRGVDQLIEKGHVTPFHYWQQHHTLLASPPLDEANRCALEILSRWPTST